MPHDPHGRKLGVNELCWCGSGLKFKRCHLNRSSEISPSRAEVLQDFLSSFSHKECLCPDDWRHQCKGDIVRAHSLSRRNALKVVTEAGHVFSFTPNWGRLFHKDQYETRVISARDASTFTGFCGYHDRQIFSALDREDFDGSVKLTALSAYRTLCREIFMKKGHLRTAELAKTLDRGRSPSEQYLIQEAAAGTLIGAGSALLELTDIRLQFETALKTSDFHNFACYNFHFSEMPHLLTTGVFNPSHDLSGNFLQDLSSIETYSQNVFFSILPDVDGFWASFLWPRGYSLTEQFVKDVEQNYNTVGGIYAVALAHVENTFLRPSYWDNLSQRHKESFQFLAMMDVTHRDYRRAKKVVNDLKSLHPTKPDHIVGG